MYYSDESDQIRINRITQAIDDAERKVHELREAMRILERIANKRRRNERDMELHEQMIKRIDAYDLVVPSAWKELCW